MKPRFAILFTTIITLFAAPLFAATPENVPACKDDIERLCKKVKSGEGRVAKCLQDNQAKMTVGCKDGLNEMLEVEAIHSKMKNFRTTCKGDLESLCPGVPSGKGRQVKCLEANADKLTPTCKTTLENEGFAMGTTGTPATSTAKAAPATQTAPSGTTAPAAPAPAAPAAPAPAPAK